MSTSAPLSSDPASSATRSRGHHWPMWPVVVVVVAVAAAAAGVLVGRSTNGGGATSGGASWQALPAAPITGRLSPSAVWTGKEMIVWGGHARSGTIEAGKQGAAYDPATRTWLPIAPSPAGMEGGGAAGVAWTGREMLVWASNSPDGPVGAGAYDPASDTWRSLPAGPLGNREGYASVWTGKELVVVGGNLGDSLAKPLVAALDPTSGSWRLLPALEKISGLLPGPGVVWDGRRVWVSGTVCAKYLSECSPVFLAYDPATDTLRKIDLSTMPADRTHLSLVATYEGDLVFSTVGVANGRIFLVRYDPVANAWKRGSFAPVPVPETAYTQTAWLGDRYVAADGSSGLQIYSVPSDTWETITPGPSPLNSREGSAIAWTGQDLIAWSGTVYEKYNPTPADGASLALG